MPFIRKISTSGLDDDLLLNRFRKTADANLLAELFDRYIEMIYAVCIRYLEDRELSKDAVMEIFHQLSDKLARHEVGNFRSWLYTVAKNHCLMQLRSAARYKKVNIDDSHVQFESDMHPSSENEKEMQFTRLSDCFDQLNAEQKQVIDLFYLQEKCYNDIVVISGFEWNKVRSLVQNGRRNLKICMDKKQYDTAENASRKEPAKNK